MLRPYLVRLRSYSTFALTCLSSMPVQRTAAGATSSKRLWLVAEDDRRFPSVSLFLGLQKRVIDAQAFDLLPVLQVFGQETVGSASERGLEDQGVPE